MRKQEKYRQRAGSLQIEPPTHTSSETQAMIERVYVYVSMHVFQEKKYSENKSIVSQQLIV